MIEIKGHFSEHKWEQLFDDVYLDTLSRFGYEEVRIQGKVYTDYYEYEQSVLGMIKTVYTEEFIEAFNKERMWEKLCK